MNKFAEIFGSIANLSKSFFEMMRMQVIPRIVDFYYIATEFLAPRWKKYLVSAAIIISTFIVFFTFYVYIVYQINYDEIHNSLEKEYEWLYGRGLSRQKPPIKIYDRNRKLLGVYLPERGSHMTMRTCKKMIWLKKAAVSSEDRDFYNHAGVSYTGIARAFAINLMTFSLSQGGGTITQQLARNLFTDRARTLKRKLYETFIAWSIEGKLNKEEILCLYLNKIYMGEGRIGAEEASWFYFKKPPESLDAAEAAMIVGLFPSPVRYSPLNNIELSLQKQKTVLSLLVKDGYLKPLKEKIMLQSFLRKYDVEKGPSWDPGKIGIYGASRDFRFNIAPSANAFVKHYLYENLEEDLIMKGGLKVFTTIDKHRQKIALGAVRRQVETLRHDMLKKSKSRNQKDLKKLSRRINGVLVSMKPQTGEILALVGSYSVTEGKMYERPFTMRRQPGSSLKGFLYAVAINEEVLDVNSLVKDIRFRQGKWSPRNWNGKYLGEIPVRKAIAISSNSAAVRTLDDIGVRVFKRRMMSAIDENDSDRFKSNLTLALGSGELTPVEMTRIYAMINNGGRTVKPQLIVSIENDKGETILANSENEDYGNELLTQESCQKAVKLMTYVFDPETNGTASFIGKRRSKNPDYLPFDVAGKTGTVQVVSQVRKKFPGVYGSQTNAWFVGLVPGETTVLWFGNDEGAPIARGGVSAAVTWAGYAQGALKGKITERFAEVEIEDETPEDQEAELEENQNLNKDESLEIENKKEESTDVKKKEDIKKPVDTMDKTTKNKPDNVPVATNKEKETGKSNIKKTTQTTKTDQPQ